MHKHSSHLGCEKCDKFVNKNIEGHVIKNNFKCSK